MNRRELLGGLGATAGLGVVRPSPIRAAAPTAPVAVAKCRSYGAEYLTTMEKMFDQLGGLGRLVKGKTVAIKVNFTGPASNRLGYLPAGRTLWTNPRTIGAVIHLLGKAGAKRIRVLEGAWVWPDSLEEFLLKAAYDPRELLNAAPIVEMVNTNMPYRGGKPYTRFPVPKGGHLFPGFDLNTAYSECDVFVSMAKMKEHIVTGVTLSMKNCFGITPTTIYGDRCGIDEPSPVSFAGRHMIVHNGARQPSMSAPSERDPASPREAGYRVPRCVADVVAARPIHLALLEGIDTMAGGEVARPGTRPCSPGYLAAGMNPVTTDAVGTALMGFDPTADRGTAPFETCDSTLRLAEELGVGTRDLKQIEVIGTPIRDAVFRFRDVPGGRPSSTDSGRRGV